MASGYDASSTHYLVEGFRQGFHLRLERPVDQISEYRRCNKQAMKGNNKTALDNPQAMEVKLEKELQVKRMIGLFMGPVFPSYIISPWASGKRSTGQVLVDT